MGVLQSRFGPETNILCEQVKDLVHTVEGKDPEMAELIQRCLTTLCDENISEKQYKKMLEKIGSIQSRREEKKVNDLSEFTSWVDKQPPAIDKFIREQGENYADFWKDFDCSTKYLSKSISRLWKCIDDENNHTSSPIRRRISLVLIFQFQERIRARIKTRINCANKAQQKLPDTLTSRRLVPTIICQNVFKIYSSSDDSKPILERKSFQKLRKYFLNEMTKAGRYAGLEHGKLLILGLERTGFFETCTVGQVKEVQEHLAEKECTRESTCQKGLLKALLDVEAITDIELDAFIKSTGFPCDDDHGRAIEILFCSEVENSLSLGGKRKRGEEDIQTGISNNKKFKTTFHRTPDMCSSIYKMLNPMDVTTESAQFQQSSLVENSSLQIADKVSFYDHNPNFTVGERAEIGSSRRDSLEARDPRSKRRRVDSLPEPDSHVSQKLSRITGDEQREIVGNSIVGTDVMNKFAATATTFRLLSVKLCVAAYIFEHLQPKKQCGSFTEAIVLRFPERPAEDFEMVIYLCFHSRQGILQGNVRFEDLRNILGDCIFEGMRTSNLRKEEEAKGKVDCTEAFSIIENGSDCTMKVVLSFVAGIDIHQSFSASP